MATLRQPAFLPLIPSVSHASTDPRKAAPSVPAHIDALQHSLATGRHSGMGIGLFLDNGDSATVFIPVPPSVTHVGVSGYVGGFGEVSIVSSNDSTERLFTPTSNNYLIPEGLQHFSTSGLPLGNIDSPLKVRSEGLNEAPWTWATETLTVSLNTSTLGSGYLHSICVTPIFLANDID